MNIVQITPGAGGMYCGGCFRDNALVAALRKLGHKTVMVPLYLPLTLDEADQSEGTPIFFSGVNVYLEQKLPWFRRAPEWLHQSLASPLLLKLLGGMAGQTRAQDVGELTISMLRGEEGNQAREVDQLAAWLQSERCDVISLSNVLLVGMARRLKEMLHAPIVCMLQGEDAFVDGLPEAQRSIAWKILVERAREVDLFIAPSRYFAELMSRRLSLSPERVRVVPNGINLEGFTTRELRTAEDKPPVLGYFARMCAEKGLGLVVDVFVELKRRGRVPGLRLHAGGGCGPGDEPFVEEQKGRLDAAGLLKEVKFFPNVSRAEKISFLKSLAVFCTPALYGEAFGLYVIEALAAGAPVVQPRHAAFPEIVEATGGGLIAQPTVSALSETIESLLLDPVRARALGEAGRSAVLQRFSVERMAEGVLNVCQEAIARAPGPAASIRASMPGVRPS